MADITPSNYQYIMAFYIRPHVLEVRMNRPEKRNAMSPRVWQEIGHVFSEIVPAEADCRCVILTGAGKVFSAGIELAGANTFGGGHGGKRLDGAQRAVTTLKSGGAWQNAWKAINLCTKPVIACMQRGCFGAALEMVCFADIRYCTQDCIFQAPEVDLGIAADLGGNQLFPKIIGNDSLVRELQFSGRRFTSEEALQFGLVSKICKDQTELMQQGLEMATMIAEKSPIAVMGVKTMLNYSRDHNVEDSLRFGLTWNTGMAQTKDMAIAGQAFFEKKKPVFENAPTLKDRDSKL